MNIRSEYLKLSQNDLFNGLIMTVTGAVLGGIYTAITSDVMLTSALFIAILKSGAVSGLGYLMKNLFRNSDGKFFKPEEKNEKS